MPARHPIDGVVHEEHRDRLSAISRVQDLGRADRREIAIPLVAQHDAVRTRPLHAHRDRRGAAVRRLHIADIQIVIPEYRTAHGAHQDRAVLYAQFINGPRD